MSHPNKIRGTRWESAVRDWWHERGRPQVERRPLDGIKDRGDLTGFPDWTLQCKDEKTITLGTYMDETRKQAAHAGTRFFAAVVKRRNRGVAEAYVVMPHDIWAKVAEALDAAGIPTAL